jgi:hypothetical protein
LNDLKLYVGLNSCAICYWLAGGVVMQRELFKVSAVLLCGTILFFTSALYMESANAIPPFARQTDNPCGMCHFQHFPKLKQFGRIFKANGLSLSAQPRIEANDLSIPAYLNATFYTKSKAILSSSTTGNRKGRLAIPDEAAILVGGRLAEGVGGVVEWGGPLLSSKVIFSRPMAGAGRMGLTIFTTDGLGPGYGFEVMNTGAVRNHSPFEQSTKVILGSVDNLELAQAATGVAFFGFLPGKGYVTASLYAPDSNEAGLTNMDTGADLSHYLRAVYMPPLPDWDVGVGIGVYGGSTKATVASNSPLVSGGDMDCQVNAGEVCNINTQAWFIDAQAQSLLDGHELGIYFMYAQGDDPNSKAGEVNLFASSPGNSKPKGWGVDAEYSVLPHLHLLVSASRSDNGGVGDKKLLGFGLYFQIAQNIAIQPMIERSRGTQGVDTDGDPITQATVTLEADF